MSLIPSLFQIDAFPGELIFFMRVLNLLRGDLVEDQNQYIANSFPPLSEPDLDVAWKETYGQCV